MDFTHVLSSMETRTPPPMKAGRKVLALTRQTSFIKWPNDGFKGPREAKDHKSRFIKSEIILFLYIRPFHILRLL